MEPIILALFDVSVFILLAEILSSLVQKYSLPKLVGELLAGMIIGPYALGSLLNQLVGFTLININDYIVFLAEFSVILLIFASGLEHGIAPIKSSGVLGFLGATLGALLPFFVTFYLYLPQFGFDSALFLGTAMGATSLAAVASVIEEQRLKGKGVNFLVSAAAVDDVVDLILLSVVLAILQGASTSVASVGLKITTLIVVWLVILAVSVVLIPRVTDRISDKYLEEFPLAVLFGLTLFMVSLGYSSIISAFVAGVAFANSAKSEKIKGISNALLSVFGPLFFVYVGAEVDFRTLNLDTLLLSLELTAVATVFKWLGIFPFALAYLRNFKAANTVALGMVPRGETGLVIASLGLSYNALSLEEFEGIVFMSLFTTLIGSALFKVYAKKHLV
ncbi:sodium:proton antiporter [Sulfolobales archaeon SCGC AB-777_J03]|nr:sodium:proton antiporter [Sulfolobales archaeon SCGC AB-777_J03]